MKRKSIAIIGAGITGCSLARLLAEQHHVVDLYEQNPYVGGNCYDYYDEFGVLIHKYGPHIFHTSDEAVWAFANRFTAFNKYINQVLVEVNGQLVQMPINLNSIKALFPVEYKAFEAEIIKLQLQNQSVSISDLKQQITNVNSLKIVNAIFDLVYANYTAKMWGIDINAIDPTVIQRVKINLNHEWNYFPNDKYQGLPVNGYTAWFNNMINHENINLYVNHKPSISNQKQVIIVDKKHYDLVIYTGMIENLFENCYGPLPYRSLKIVFEHHFCPFYQTTGVINYPAHKQLTRICEYKYLTQQAIDSTTISYEYPGEYNPNTAWNTPFYAINNQKNAEIYQAYCKLCQQYSNLIVAGRLGHYKYYDMDDALAYSLQLMHEIEKRFTND